ncbi:XPO4 [Auxenochlorella protothecoides x Auxenochlorella symbiontica]
MDLASIQTVIEAASNALENPLTRLEAERTLLDFRCSPSPLAACQHILSHSSVPAAQFQAVLTLRDASLRLWPELGAPERQGVTRFVLEQALHRSRESLSLVRSQCVLTAAQLVKRGHGDASQSDLGLEGLVRGIVHRALSTRDLHEQRTCLELLTALTAECNPQSASPMEKPWSWHDKARQDFERGALAEVALCALRVGAAAAPAAAAYEDQGVAAAALTTLCAVLSWGFASGREALMMHVSTQLGDRPGGDGSRRGPNRLSQEVHAVLSSPGALDWCLHLSAALSGPPACDREAARALRQLAVHLAQTSEPLGPHRPAPTYTAWSLRLAFQAWLWPPGAALDRAEQGTEEEFLDGCRVVAAAAAAAPVSAPRLWDWVEPGEGTQTRIAAAAELTRAVLSTLASDPHRDDWLTEAGRTLVDAWAALATGLEGVQGGAEAAAAVFEAGLRRGLALAAAEATQDEDDAGEHAEAATLEHDLACLAAIGRGAGAPVLAAVSSALVDARSRLEAAVAAASDPSVPLEQLCWLLQVAAALLADAPGADAGDSPALPLAWDAMRDAAAAASMQLLAVAQLCVTHGGHDALSPRLLEVTCVSLGRWAATWFPTEASLPPASGAQDADVAQLLVQLARTAFLAYPGETALHKKASRRLLRALPTSAPAAATLLRCDSWLDLCRAVASQELLVSADVARPLLCALCLAAKGDDAEGAAAYVRHLVQPSVDRLQELAGDGRRDVLWRADVTPRVLFWLESVRGAMQGTCTASVRPLTGAAQQLARPLSLLLPAYRGQSEVTTALLKLAAAVGENLLPLVTDAQVASQLSSWGLDLLRTHARHAQGVSDLSVRQTEAQRDLRAFLKLLAAMARSGSAEAGPAAETELVQVVAEGLGTIMPLLPPDLPAHPKLCHSFFDTVAFMLETFPGAMASLPPHVWGALMGTLFQGLGMAGGGLALTQVVLDGLAALATFHVKDALAGGKGVRDSNVPGPGREWAGCHSPLAALLVRALQRVVFEERGAGVVAAAAPALLPLVMAEPEAVLVFRADLVHGIEDPQQQRLVSVACESLVADLPQALNPRAKARFLSQLESFAEVARAAARRK